MVPHSRQTPGTATAQLARPLTSGRGFRNVLVLEVRVHRDLPLEPFLTSRTHEWQGRTRRLLTTFLFLHLDGDDILLVGSPVVPRLLSQLLQEGGVEYCLLVGGGAGVA